MELTAEEDDRMTLVVLDLTSRAYGLKIGKDITREKLETAFTGRPELENLKVALSDYLKEVIRARH